MIEIPKAYVGYNQTQRAYIAYSGNLTKAKEAELRKKLIDNGFHPGWKTKDVQVRDAVRGLNPYREDGASGATEVIILK